MTSLALAMAEGAGFEPAVGLPTTAFKAVPIGRSGTPPCGAEPAPTDVTLVGAYSEPPSSISTAS